VVAGREEGEEVLDADEEIRANRSQLIEMVAETSFMMST